MADVPGKRRITGRAMQVIGAAFRRMYSAPVDDPLPQSLADAMKKLEDTSTSVSSSGDE